MDQARRYLGLDINDAVITVPAYFTDSQLQATLDAAEIAGINVRQLLKEPCAAAIAYGFHSDIKAKKNVLVYDLGGGTFDVSVMEISQSSYNVLAYDGDSKLGGVDFDNRLVYYFAKVIRHEHKFDIFADNEQAAVVKYRLKQACEQAKRDLSSMPRTVIKIPALLPNVDFRAELSRELFDKLCYDLYEKTIKIVRRVLQTAKMSHQNIDEVSFDGKQGHIQLRSPCSNQIVLAGGSTRIATLRSILQHEFGDKQLCQHIHPDEAVAYGAAVQAALVTSENYGVSEHFHIESDKLAHSIGQGMADGTVVEIFRKNTSIPKGAKAIKVERSVFPVYDDQRSITIAIYEGESKLISESTLLGKFVLDNLRPTSFWRQTEIRVTYSIDRNGILSVTAEEVNAYARNQKSVKINKSRLSEAEINDSIKFMADIKRKQIEKKAAYDSLLMQMDFRTSHFE